MTLLYTVLVLIVVYIIVYWRDMNYLDSQLQGFWVANSASEFCQNALIDTMMLYIGDQTEDMSLLNTTRKGYLVVTPNICAQEIKITYNKFSLKKECHIKIEFEDEDEDIFPSELTMKIDFKYGHLALYNDDEIFASLYKRYDLC